MHQRVLNCSQQALPI